jgi:hypothetical protein
MSRLPWRRYAHPSEHGFFGEAAGFAEAGFDEFF